MYHIKYLTSDKEYVSQIGQSLKLGFHKQLKYTTTHNQHSVYALHVFNHQHQHGPIQDTVELKTPQERVHARIARNRVTQQLINNTAY